MAALPGRFALALSGLLGLGWAQLAPRIAQGHLRCLMLGAFIDRKRR
ncbi:hypothetical protein [Rhodobacter viridis]|nr:hypothetical protein [Rhodobacter viridis]